MLLLIGTRNAAVAAVRSTTRGPHLEQRLDRRQPRRAAPRSIGRYSLAVTGPADASQSSVASAPAGRGAAVPLAVAGILGGLLHLGKGVVLLAGGPDLSFVPAMLVLFSLGLLALHERLNATGGWAVSGLVTAWAATGFGLASVACQVAGWQPENAADPVAADIAYGGATVAIFIGLLLLGIAWARDRSIDHPWRIVPLVVGIVWFPLEGLTAVLPDGWGLALAGLTWVVAASAPLLATERAVPSP